MTAAPWLLSLLGVVMVIFGAIASGTFAAGSSRTSIDPGMSGAETGTQSNRRRWLGFPGLMIFAGLICLLAGAGWRLFRVFF